MSKNFLFSMNLYKFSILVGPLMRNLFFIPYFFLQNIHEFTSSLFPRRRLYIEFFLPFNNFIISIPFSPTIAAVDVIIEGIISSFNKCNYFY